jgi:hypothetical protein
LLIEYGVSEPEQRTLTAIAHPHPHRASGWWQPYTGVLPAPCLDYLITEAAASQIQAYQPQQIPDLLQTPAPAAASSWTAPQASPATPTPSPCSGPPPSPQPPPRTCSGTWPHANKRTTQDAASVQTAWSWPRVARRLVSRCRSNGCRAVFSSCWRQARSKLALPRSAIAARLPVPSCTLPDAVLIRRPLRVSG